MSKPIHLDSGADMGAAIDQALQLGYRSGKVEFYIDASGNALWGLELNGPNQCMATLGDTLTASDGELNPDSDEFATKIRQSRVRRA